MFPLGPIWGRSPGRLNACPISAELQERLKVLEKNAYLGRFYFAKARKGKEPNLAAVRTRWYGYLKLVFDAAGIKGVRTHRFRHSLAELMLGSLVELVPGTGKMGYMPPRDVGSQLGHKDDQQVRKTYHEELKKQEGRAVGYGKQILDQMVAKRKSTPAHLSVDAQLTMDELASRP